MPMRIQDFLTLWHRVGTLSISVQSSVAIW